MQDVFNLTCFSVSTLFFTTEIWERMSAYESIWYKSFYVTKNWLKCKIYYYYLFRCMIYDYKMINKDILLVNENCVTFIRITNIIILSKIFCVEQSEFNSIHCANRLYNFEHTVK